MTEVKNQIRCRVVNIEKSKMWDPAYSLVWRQVEAIVYDQARVQVQGHIIGQVEEDLRNE